MKKDDLFAQFNQQHHRQSQAQPASGQFTQSGGLQSQQSGWTQAEWQQSRPQAQSGWQSQWSQAPQQAQQQAQLSHWQQSQPQQAQQSQQANFQPANPQQAQNWSSQPNQWQQNQWQQNQWQQNHGQQASAWSQNQQGQANTWSQQPQELWGQQAQTQQSWQPQTAATTTSSYVRSEPVTPPGYSTFRAGQSPTQSPTQFPTQPHPQTNDLLRSLSDNYTANSGRQELPQLEAVQGSIVASESLQKSAPATQANNGSGFSFSSALEGQESELTTTLTKTLSASLNAPLTAGGLATQDSPSLTSPSTSAPSGALTAENLELESLTAESEVATSQAQASTPLSELEELQGISLSVSTVLQQVKEYLEQGNPPGGMWVLGEISQMSTRGQHAYITLRDAQDEVVMNCTVFGWARQLARWEALGYLASNLLSAGTRVFVCGNFELYKPRGSLSFRISQMRIADGFGLQYRMIEQIRQEIITNGWNLNPKPIPRFPSRVGLVTSAQAAGYADMCAVFRDVPEIQLVNYECNVQGEKAVATIVQALQLADAQYCQWLAWLNSDRSSPEPEHVDLIIVGRGGGSFQDLIAFSSRELVVAIAGLTIPCISAVGHQTDNPLSDLVADLYAYTPTHAAKIVTENFIQLRQDLVAYRQYLQETMTWQLNNRFQYLSQLKSILAAYSPTAKIDQVRTELANGQEFRRSLVNQRLNHLEQTLAYQKQQLGLESQRALNTKVQQYWQIRQGFSSRELLDQLSKQRHLVDDLKHKLQTGMRTKLYYRNQELMAAKQFLQGQQQVLNTKLERVSLDLGDLKRTMYVMLNNKLSRYTRAVSKELSTLERLDPTYPLTRGYALLRDPEGSPVSGVDALAKLPYFQVVLADGATNAISLTKAQQAGGELNSLPTESTALAPLELQQKLVTELTEKLAQLEAFFDR